MLEASEFDWLVVQENLWGSRQSWTRIAQVLTWEGVSLRTPGNFYKFVLQ